MLGNLSDSRAYFSPFLYGLLSFCIPGFRSPPETPQRHIFRCTLISHCLWIAGRCILQRRGRDLLLIRVDIAVGVLFQQRRVALVPCHRWSASPGDDSLVTLVPVSFTFSVSRSLGFLAVRSTASWEMINYRCFVRKGWYPLFLVFFFSGKFSV